MTWDECFESFADVKPGEARQIWEALEPVLRGCNSMGSALDFGCGDGWASVGLRELGFREVIAFDPVPSAIQRARETVGKAGGIRFLGSYDELGKILPGSMDLILLNMVLTVVSDTSENLDRTLTEARRLLGKDGRMVIVVPHPCFRNMRHRHYFTDFDLAAYHANYSAFQTTLQKGDGASVSFTDFHLNLDGIAKHLRQKGLSIENLDELNDGMPGSPVLILECRKTVASHSTWSLWHSATAAMVTGLAIAASAALLPRHDTESTYIAMDNARGSDVPMAVLHIVDISTGNVEYSLSPRDEWPAIGRVMADIGYPMTRSGLTRAMYDRGYSLSVQGVSCMQAVPLGDNRVSFSIRAPCP